MRAYETLFVLRVDLPDAQVRETIDRARRLIESLDGTVEEVEDWGVRELAYPIRKETRGYYILINYAAASAAVRELERTLRLAEEVLRYITVHRVPKQERTSRRSRPAGDEERGLPKSDAAKAEG